MPNAVVILSGGAPNSPLVAGALAAIYSNGKTFNTVYASGAGALLGMLFLAPKNNTVVGALEATLNTAVDDRIYSFFPIGYKTFFKDGPFTKAFIKTAAAFQLTNPAIPPRMRRFYNDLIDLWFVAATPSTTMEFSQGLCLPVPFVSDFVDFELLRSPQMQGRFFMNAYCIDTATVDNFSNQQITEECFHAALAFPFVYSPAVVNGKHYFEGSSVDPINFHNLTKLVLADVLGASPTMVLIDVLGAFEAALVRTPRNLIDAYGISIITPICSLARQAKEIFGLNMPDEKLHCLAFDVPDSKKPYMLDWTYSNMTEMWKIGWAAGEKFVAENGSLLPDRSLFEKPAPPSGPNPK